MDIHTAEQRSYNMSKILSRNTKPELVFRHYIWKKGIRGYRLNSKKPGKPDLYFSKKKLAVFIDGCFWHKCPVCFVKPKSNNDYWDSKIARNIERDGEINKILADDGLGVIRFWEHEIKNNPEACLAKLKRALQ